MQMPVHQAIQRAPLTNESNMLTSPADDSDHELPPPLVAFCTTQGSHQPPTGSTLGGPCAPYPYAAIPHQYSRDTYSWNLAQSYPPPGHLPHTHVATPQRGCVVRFSLLGPGKRLQSTYWKHHKQSRGFREYSHSFVIRCPPCSGRARSCSAACLTAVNSWKARRLCGCYKFSLSNRAWSSGLCITHS
jgi:hypothetical protein